MVDFASPDLRVIREVYRYAGRSWYQLSAPGADLGPVWAGRVAPWWRRIERCRVGPSVTVGAPELPVERTPVRHSAEPF
jgi:hypothetical protein